MSRVFLLLPLLLLLGCSHVCTLTPCSSDKQFARVNRKAREFSSSESAKTARDALPPPSRAPAGERHLYLCLTDGRELEVSEFEIGRRYTAYMLSGSPLRETISTWDLRKALLVRTSKTDFASPGVGFVGGAVLGGVLAATMDDTSRRTSSRLNQMAFFIAGGAVLGGVAGWIVGHFVDEKVTSTYTVKLNSCGLQL